MRLADTLSKVPGVELLNDAFFNEFTLRLSKPAAGVVEALAGKGIIAGVPMSRLRPGEGYDDLLLVAATEMNTQEDIDLFAAKLKEVLA